MEMKEILMLTAFFLQLEEVLELPYLKEVYKENDFPADSPAEETLSKLLRCANLARAEIASDYFPLIFTEKVSSADGTISPLALTKRVIDIKRVAQNGKAVKFKVYPAVIKTAGGEVEIEYSYMPEDEGLCGETGFSDKISARVIAYGTAAEYCLVTGLFEEAVIWERRFKDSLLAAQRKKSEIKVKPRKWI